MPKQTPERIIDTPFSAARASGSATVSTGGDGGGTTYTAGDGIDISVANEISVDVTDIIETAFGIFESSGDIGVNLAVTPGLAFDAGGALMLADSVAGAGLTITSKVLAVGAGNGISVAADAVAVSLATDPGLEFSSGALRAKLATTSGLVRDSSGLAVGAGDGIDVLTSSIAVDVTDIIDTAYGLTEDTNNIRINVSGNTGLTFSSGALALGTPSALSHGSTNSVSGTAHSHAVTASADVTAGTESLLKSTAAGGLSLASLLTSGAADIGQGLTAGDTGFRVIYHTHDANHVHVVINPTGSWSLDEQFGLDVDDNLLVRGWIVGKHAIQLDGATMLLHYDGPDRTGDLSGQTRGHLGQVPTAERSVTFAPGKFGKAVHVPPATTNLVANPSFETGTTGWSFDSTGTPTGTITRVTGLGYAGAYSEELKKTGGAATDRYGARYTVSGVTSGLTYTVSAWINITAASGGNERFRLEVFSGGSGGTFVTGVTDGWRRVTRTFTASATSVSFYLSIYDADTMTVYIDAVQLEQSSYATPYCDGSLGSGHSWSGTAHASTSSRLDGQLDYAAEGVINRTKGSFMAWVRPAVANVSQMPISVSASNWLRFRGDGTLDVTWGGTNMGTSGAYVADTWYHVALTWDGTSVVLYLDGEQIDGATVSGLPSTGTLSIGYYRPSNNQRWTGLIDDVVILNRAADADEIRAVYESNAPVFAETSTWHWRAGRNRIYADAEGLWGYGASGGTILGLYAGDETDPAATKSWGGLSLSEGDFLLGRYGSGVGGWLYFDQDLTGGEPGLTFGYADVDVLRIDANGAWLDGVLDITSTGGMYIGDGSFGTPGTGVKIWMDVSGYGRISGYGTSNEQWGADTSGRLFAGAGNVNLDITGLWMASANSSSYDRKSSVVWYDDTSKTNELAFIGHFDSGGINYLHMKMTNTSFTRNELQLFAYKGTASLSAAPDSGGTATNNTELELLGIDERAELFSDDITLRGRNGVVIETTEGTILRNSDHPSDGEFFARTYRWSADSTYVTLLSGIVQGAAVSFVAYDTITGTTRYIEPGVALEHGAASTSYTSGANNLFIRINSSGNLQVWKNNANLWIISLSATCY